MGRGCTLEMPGDGESGQTGTQAEEDQRVFIVVRTQTRAEMALLDLDLQHGIDPHGENKWGSQKGSQRGGRFEAVAA